MTKPNILVAPRLPFVPLDLVACTWPNSQREKKIPTGVKSWGFVQRVALLSFFTFYGLRYCWNVPLNLRETDHTPPVTEFDSQTRCSRRTPALIPVSTSTIVSSSVPPAQ
jgi:hypothetical protein